MWSRQRCGTEVQRLLLDASAQLGRLYMSNELAPKPLDVPDVLAFYDYVGHNPANVAEQPQLMPQAITGPTCAVGSLGSHPR